jgi:hypothetical protein
MRRITLLLAGAAVGALVAGSGTQALGHVQVSKVSVSVFRCSNVGSGTPGCEAPVLALAVRPGERFSFRVGFTLGGHEEFITSHTFTFSGPKGQRVPIPGAGGGHLSRHGTGRVVAAGARGHQLAFDVPASWGPGVYRFAYSLSNRPVAALDDVVVTSGARSFLVSAPSA